MTYMFILKCALKLVLKNIQNRRLFLCLFPAPLHVFHDHVALQRKAFFEGGVWDVW